MVSLKSVTFGKKLVGFKITTGRLPENLYVQTVVSLNTSSCVGKVLLSIKYRRYTICLGMKVKIKSVETIFWKNS